MFYEENLIIMFLLNAQADIIVSELLGSFGDNELSPECLDGVQKFLKGLTLTTIHVRMYIIVSVFIRGWHQYPIQL